MSPLIPDEDDSLTEDDRDLTIFTQDEADEIARIFRQELRKVIVRGDEYFVGNDRLLGFRIPSYRVVRDLIDRTYILESRVHNLIASTDATWVEKIKLCLRKLLHL
jgi:hypothetical protein